MITMFRQSRRKGFAVLEYIALLILILWALWFMRPYIQQGVMGQYQKAGETFGFGRQYIPGATGDFIK